MDVRCCIPVLQRWRTSVLAFGAMATSSNLGDSALAATAMNCSLDVWNVLPIASFTASFAVDNAAALPPRWRLPLRWLALRRHCA